MAKKKTLHGINLLAALKELSDLMNDDGRVKQIGLQAHLRNYNVSYDKEVTKWLNKAKVIGYDPKGNHKNPIIFWNKKENPSLAWCENIFDEIREDKRKSAAIKKELDKFDDLGQIPVENPEIVKGAPFNENLYFAGVTDDGIKEEFPKIEGDWVEETGKIPPGYVDHLGRQTEIEKLNAQAENDNKVLGWRKEQIDNLLKIKKDHEGLVRDQFLTIQEMQMELNHLKKKETTEARGEYIKEALRESEAENHELRNEISGARDKANREYNKRLALKKKYKKLKKLIKAVL